MFKLHRAHLATMLLTFGVLGFECGPTSAAVRIEGQVQAGGGGIANSSVTLWAASTGKPSQLAQARTDGEGRFELASQETPGADVILYALAKGGEALVNRGNGDNPAIAMLSVLGNSPPSPVVINEMTTVASVWTLNQFIDGTAIKGDNSASRSPPATCRALSIFKQVVGARLFKTHSTAARLRRWRTSLPCPTCCLVALRW